MIRCAKLPVTLPLSDIQAEVSALPSDWKDHLNTAHYRGNWTVLSLRAPGGNPEHVVADRMGSGSYADTPLMARTPALRKFLDSLPFPLWSVRLMRLAPGSLIKEHRDPDLSLEQGEARLHIPLFTHDGVEFFVDGDQVRMREGECWYINANLPHRVANSGPGDRIHLVVDGPVTPELRVLFDKGEVRYSTVHRPPGEQEAIIRELRLQGAHAVADRLEAECAADGTAEPLAGAAPALRNWIPSALIRREGEWLCRWLNVEDVPFTDPFFDETLNICRNRPANRRSSQVLGSIPAMVEWAEAMPSVTPSAFIFHVSRCGSTLAAQLLGLDRTHIVLAEVPFIDDLLRASYREPESPIENPEEAVKSAFRFYGQQRHGAETRLFVKADSWHIFFYPLLRALYPTVPFFLLYRSPDEVLYSHRRRRGMQSVPGVIERDILWAPGEESGPGPAPTDLDVYMAGVLGRYMERFLQIDAIDPHAHLVNYAEGISEITERIARATDTPISAALKTEMSKRSGFHAKNPGQVFSEEAGSGLPEALLEPLLALYGRLEKQRLAQ